MTIYEDKKVRLSATITLQSHFIILNFCMRLNLFIKQLTL